GQEVSGDDRSVAPELGAAARRPAAELELPILGLLVGLGPGELRGSGPANAAPDGQGPNPAGPVARDLAEEWRPDPGIGIEDDDELPAIHVGRRRGQGGALPVAQAGTLAANDSEDRRESCCLGRR